MGGGGRRAVMAHMTRVLIDATLFTTRSPPTGTDRTFLRGFPSLAECEAAMAGLQAGMTAKSHQRRLISLFCIEGFEDHGWSE